MDEITVTRLINGPEAFTPDNEFCLGESEVRGFFVAAGFCAHGLAGAGGIGRADGRVDRRGRAVDRRVGDGHPPLRPALPLARATRSSAPGRCTRPTTTSATPATSARPGRPLRISSAYPWHREHGAAFGEKSGWERVNWYESNAPAGDESLRPRGWAGMHWSPAIGAEHRATRERAGLFDESSFAKLEIAGPRRGRVPRTPVRQPRRPRRRGDHLHADAQPPRRASSATSPSRACEEELFSIVTGTAFGNHDLSWIRRHAPADGSVRCSDVTARWACFALWGPRARDILAPLTDDPLDFGYMRMRELAVGDVPVRALRVTFVGELGWELYCPTEYGAGLWRTLWEARPRARDASPGGYRAIDSLRLEKGYRVWAADITADETPLRGRARLLREGRRGVRRRRGARGAPAAPGEAAPRLRCLVLEDPRSVALGNEPVRVRRRGRRSRHQRRLRLHGGALDRLRLPARRASSVGRRGRDRHLRRVGRRARSRASRCSTPRASASAPSGPRASPRRAPRRDRPPPPSPRSRPPSGPVAGAGRAPATAAARPV